MHLNHRYDFVLLFDVKDGNPNGDPDAGNLPRLDPETGHGLVTDVAIKRKIRNFVALTQDQAEVENRESTKRREIYVREKAILNLQHDRAYAALGLQAQPGNESAEPAAQTPDAEAKKGEGAGRKVGKPKGRKGSGDEVERARVWMCRNFYDVRTFGAVMSTGTNAGQVRGPVQLTFARSVDPIVPLEHSITRMAITTEAEAVRQHGDNRTMGRKHTVPYGLYRAHGFVSAFLAKQTHFDQSDLELLWQALSQMFEHDRSATRGQMATRGLYVFEHASELGNAHAHALFDRIAVTRAEGVSGPARGFEAYAVTFDSKPVAIGARVEAQSGVTLIRVA
jgi:CRISPR-associated protein Csd2